MTVDFSSSTSGQHGRRQPWTRKRPRRHLTPSATSWRPQDSLITERAGNEADKIDMYRMGKVQQMQRIFRLFPMFSFCMVLMASWEIALGASTISLFNGGTAGTIYMYIVCWIGFLAVYSSMAEMGSMAATSGGQYHW